MEYLNVNNAPDPSSYPNGTYSWMRVLAGAKGSRINGLTMESNLDMNGFQILNSGGGGGPGGVYLKDSVIWRPGGTIAEGVVVSTSSADINNLIATNLQLKVIYVDTTVGTPTVNSVIDCDNRIELSAFKPVAATADPSATIVFTGAGNLLNPARLLQLNFQANNASGPILSFNNSATLNQFVDIRLCAFETNNTQPLVSFTTSAGKDTRVYVEGSLIPVLASPSPSVTSTGAGNLIIAVEDGTTLGNSGASNFFSSATPTPITCIVSSQGVCPFITQTNASSYTVSLLNANVVKASDVINTSILTTGTTANTFIGATVQDMVNAFKILNSFGFMSFFANTASNIFGVGGGTQEPNMTGTISPTLVNYGNADYSARSLPPSHFQCKTHKNILIEANYYITVISQSGNVNMTFYFQVDGAINRAYGVFDIEMPPTGQSICVPCKFYQPAWRAGGFLGRFYMQANGEITVNVKEFVATSKTLPDTVA